MLGILTFIMSFFFYISCHRHFCAHTVPLLPMDSLFFFFFLRSVSDGGREEERRKEIRGKEKGGRETGREQIHHSPTLSLGKLSLYRVLHVVAGTQPPGPCTSVHGLCQLSNLLVLILQLLKVYDTVSSQEIVFFSNCSVACIFHLKSPIKSSYRSL